MSETYKFSKKEIEELRAKARVAAEEEAKERQEKALYQEFLNAERQKVNEDPNEDQIEFTLNLAPCQKPNLTIDGRKYWEGVSYVVGRKVYNSIMEMEQNGWRHEAQIAGKPVDFYQKKNPLTLGKTSVTGYQPNISKVTTTKSLKESANAG